jgi:hypothetical protein
VDWHHDGDTVLGGIALGAGLVHEILVGAGQSREPVQHRYLLLPGAGWQVDGAVHVAGQGVSPVPDAQLLTLEAAVTVDGFHGCFLRDVSAEFQ